MRKIKFAFISLAATSAAMAGSGPAGVWMLTDGDAGTDVLIQGGSVQTFAQAASSVLQYPVAWSPTYMGGSFMTVGRDINQVGGVYDINHNQVDLFVNYSTIDGQHLDGTLDTAANRTYAVNFSTGDVIQYNDALFNGPVSSIYNVGGSNLWSITYNAVTGTLFLGGNGIITEITTGGVFVDSFNTPDNQVRSLAFDATDGTMWYLSASGADIVQINDSGTELDRVTVNIGGNYWGGEIAPVPEPATFIALGLGMAALLIRQKK